MKTLKFLSIISLLALLTMAFSCNGVKVTKTRAVSATEVCIVYTADNANSIAGAAIAQRRYPHNVIINIDNMTAANELTAIQLIVSGDSVHRVLLMVDTSTVFATNKLTGANYDSLVERIYTDTASGVAPDAAPTYYQATATKNLCEVVWTALYPTYTLPLVFEYLGDDVFAALTSRTKQLNTDSTAVDSTLTLVADAYNGDFIELYEGTGMGQTREVYDGSTTRVYVTPDWTNSVLRPHKTTKYRILSDENELFYDMYTQNFVLTYLSDLSNGPIQENWGKLFDKNDNINNGNVHYTAYQDLNYLQNTLLVKGKAIFDFAVQQTDP
jgi:hypothetical protein